MLDFQEILCEVMTQVIEPSGGNKKMSLETKFFQFVRSFPGAESIDGLKLTGKQDSRKRADFFFENRTIVCECKSLKTDTQDKVERILGPYRLSPYWPEHFEEIGLADLANRFPDAETIKQKVVGALTSAVEFQVKKANRQIRETKHSFQGESAGGFLVILNDGVNALSPEFITHRVVHTFRKQARDGQRRYTEIVCALLITQTHYLKIDNDKVFQPLILISNSGADQKLAFVTDFAEAFAKSWTKFCGAGYFDPGRDFSWDRHPSHPFEKVTVPIDGFGHSSSLIVVPRKIVYRRRK